MRSAGSVLSQPSAPNPAPALRQVFFFLSFPFSLFLVVVVVFYIGSF